MADPPTTTVPTLDHTQLIGLAIRLARARRLWEDHVVHREDDRRPVKLISSAQCDAWVIGWLPGQGVELHDHGHAAGALTVVEGTLVDLVAVNRRLRPRSLPAGTTVFLPQHTVHDVVAPGPGPATSIHVYSPPLTEMTFYEGPGGEAVRSSAVVPEPAVLSGRDVSRVFHPSGA